MLEVGLLLGLIAKYSCEECKLLLFLDGKFVVFEIENHGTILTNLVTALDKVKVSNAMRYLTSHKIYPLFEQLFRQLYATK